MASSRDARCEVQRLMNRQRIASLVHLLVLALIVGGCGAPESGGPPSGTSVSIGATAASSNVIPGRTTQPTTPTLLAPTVTSKPTIAQPTVTTRGASYTQEEIDYFLEVALGTEYGDSEQTIKKWAQDIRIEVLGTPTDEDLQTLDDVEEEINGLIDGVE